MTTAVFIARLELATLKKSCGTVLVGFSPINGLSSAKVTRGGATGGSVEGKMGGSEVGRPGGSTAGGSACPPRALGVLRDLLGASLGSSATASRVTGAASAGGA